MADGDFVDPGDMERMVRAAIAHDQRLQIIDQWLDIEAELRDSRLWAFIQNCAQQLRQEALETLARAPAHDQNRIRQLQAQAAIKANFDSFVAQLKSAYEHAENSIQIEEGLRPEDS